jgi:hypothetical protein
MSTPPVVPFRTSGQWWGERTQHEPLPETLLDIFGKVQGISGSTRLQKFGGRVAKGDIHTEFDRRLEKWVNKVEGNQRPSSSGARKEDVQAEGREMAITRHVEHFIHKKERNKIQSRNTYPRSRDPRTSKG